MDGCLENTRLPLCLVCLPAKTSEGVKNNALRLLCWKTCPFHHLNKGNHLLPHWHVRNKRRLWTSKLLWFFKGTDFRFPFL
jgi:hypothetical protein